LSARNWYIEHWVRNGYVLKKTLSEKWKSRDEWKKYQTWFNEVFGVYFDNFTLFDLFQSAIGSIVIGE
jgi:hypothetical protein